jgi:hypothetical protein
VTPAMKISATERSSGCFSKSVVNECAGIIGVAASFPIATAVSRVTDALNDTNTGGLLVPYSCSHPVMKSMSST